MTEKFDQRRNGFKAQVAMFVTADTEERREALDALIMSLPFGAVLGITGLRVSGPALHVEVVPQLTGDSEHAYEMLAQVQSVVEDAWKAVMDGDPAEIYWQSTENAPLVDDIDDSGIAGMSLPPTVARILMADPSKD